MTGSNKNTELQNAFKLTNLKQSAANTNFIGKAHSYPKANIYSRQTKDDEKGTSKESFQTTKEESKRKVNAQEFIKPRQ